MQPAALAVNEGNKPVSSKGFGSSALVVSGADRETVTLAPSGDSALKGDARKAIAAGASTTIVIRNATGKSGQVKF